MNVISAKNTVKRTLIGETRNDFRDPTALKEFQDGLMLQAEKDIDGIKDLFEECPFDDFEDLKAKPKAWLDSIFLCVLAEEVFAMLGIEDELPEWVNDERLICPVETNAYFSKNEELIECLRSTTPESHLKRNLITGGKVLSEIPKRRIERVLQSVRELSEERSGPSFG